jgi:amino acid transporter
MNSTKLNTILNAVKIALVVIGVGASLLLFNGPNVTAGTEAVEKFRDGAEMSTAIFFTIALLIVSIAIVILFFGVQLISNPKRTLLSIIGIVAALLIYVIFFAAGTTDTTDTLLLKNPVDQGTVTTTTAGIYTVIIGLIAGVLVIVLGPFMGRFRK